MSGFAFDVDVAFASARSGTGYAATPATVATSRANQELSVAIVAVVATGQLVSFDAPRPECHRRRDCRRPSFTRQLDL